jgi:hypothetical protein
MSPKEKDDLQVFVFGKEKNMEELDKYLSEEEKEDFLEYYTYPDREWAAKIDEFVQEQVQKEREHLQELIQKMEVHNKRMVILTFITSLWVIIYTWILWKVKT